MPCHMLMTGIGQKIRRANRLALCDGESNRQKRRFDMVSYKDYVAGWLDSSVQDFFQVLPGNAESIKYTLITCLDSNLEPRSLLKKSKELRSLAAEARTLGKGLLLPTRLLLQAAPHNRVFFGFDEVWFFPSHNIEPKPRSAWLIGPARIDQSKLDGLGRWMADNSCSLALGDGEGLNFIVRARGLAKHLLGHSVDQPRPNVTFLASPTASIAG